MAVFALPGTWFCCLGSPGRTKWASGKGACGEILRKDANGCSPYATTAGSCMNETNDFRHGRRIYTFRIYLLGDDDFNLANGPNMKPYGWAVFFD